MTISNSLPRIAWAPKVAGVGVVLLACWTGAIWYWRTRGSEPAAGELILVLLVAPAVAIAVFWSVFKLPRQTPPKPLSDSSTVTAQGGKTAQRAIIILAAALRLPHGTTSVELAEAISRGRTSADLAPDLFDADGYPVMAARSDEALDEALRDEVAAFFSHYEMNVQLSEEQWRALTLGTAVVRDLAERARSLLRRHDASFPVLRLIPLLPPAWSLDERGAITRWLGHAILQLGWPEQHFQITDQFKAAKVLTSSMAIRELVNETSSSIYPTAILLTCASTVGQETVDKWAASSTLFTAAHPNGKMPGEGAAGLLVSLSQQAQLEVPCTSLTLGKTVPSGSEQRSDQIRSALDDALRPVLGDMGVPADAIAKIVADAGAQDKCALGLMQFAATSMPQLDGSTDVVRIGAISGSCDCVPLIAALALADHYVREGSAPVLAVSTEEGDCVVSLVQMLSQPQTERSSMALAVDQDAQQKLS